MQQYQCIKQPKYLNKNIYRRFFDYQCEETICLTSNPPQYQTNVELYCKDLDYYISIDKEEFEEYFVKYPYETNIKRERSTMNQVQKHKELCDQLNKTYEEKNRNYGDSFGISVKKYGYISALTRMSDKWNRLETLILNKSDGTKDESLSDTLIDLANYCLMTVMELEEEKNKHEIMLNEVASETRVTIGTSKDLEEIFKESATLKSN